MPRFLLMKVIGIRIIIKIQTTLFTISSLIERSIFAPIIAPMIERIENKGIYFHIIFFALENLCIALMLSQTAQNLFVAMAT